MWLPSNHWSQVAGEYCTATNVVKADDARAEYIEAVHIIWTLWRSLLPYGYSYKASYARPG